MSRFDVSEHRIEKMTTDDLEMMKFGFDWARVFLVGQVMLTVCKGKEGTPFPAKN
jgi:hypothetical protein